MEEIGRGLKASSDDEEKEKEKDKDSEKKKNTSDEKGIKMINPMLDTSDSDEETGPDMSFQKALSFAADSHEAHKEMFQDKNYHEIANKSADFKIETRHH